MKDSLFKLSNDIKIIMNYDTQGNFTSIQLTVFNDQSQASQNLKVEL
jgi:hypothetical protein